MKTKIKDNKKNCDKNALTTAMFKKFMILAATFMSIALFSSAATLDLRFFLQGYYIGSSEMTPGLYNAEVSGATSSDVDTVIIELYDESSCTLIDSYTGVVDVDGYITCTFSSATVNEDYYIVVRHRTSIQTWSAAPVTLTSPTPASYDFTTANSQSYGSNMVDVGSGVWAFYGGDINQDGGVDGNDYIYIDNTSPTEFGYLVADINGDGGVDGNDAVLWENNNGLGLFIERPECSELRTISSQSNTNFPRFKIYPNPANCQVAIQSYESFGGGEYIAINDALGNRVKTVALINRNNKMTISIEDLLPGIYQCSLIGGNSIIASTTKLVIVK